MHSIEHHVKNAGYAARDDLARDLDTAWAHLARPGTWWAGTDRIAMAREIRHATSCAFCAECKKSLSPYAPKGTHDSVTGLSCAAIDVIHRVVTDPSRLTEVWFQRTIAAGLNEGEYAEIIATVVLVVAIDKFMAALGLPAPEFPAPLPGVPPREEPPNAKKSYAWLRTVSTRDANEHLRRVWFGDGEPGFVPRVRQVLSLSPDTLESLGLMSEAMYIPSRYLGHPTWSRPPLTRRECELVATRSAALNECFY